MYHNRFYGLPALHLPGAHFAGRAGLQGHPAMQSHREKRRDIQLTEGSNCPGTASCRGGQGTRCKNRREWATSAGPGAPEIFDYSLRKVATNSQPILHSHTDVDRSFARIVCAAHTDAALSHDQQFMTSSGHALTYSFHTILKHIAILFVILRALRIYTCYRPI